MEIHKNKEFHELQVNVLTIVRVIELLFMFLEIVGR